MAKQEHSNELEAILTTRFMRMNGVVTGLVTGILAGLILFVATLWLVIKGGPVVGPHLALLGQFFWGYTVTVRGSFIGFAYAAVVGFIFGYTVAILYNAILTWREKRIT